MNIAHYKDLLTKELDSIESSLSSIAEKGTDGQWVGSSEEMSSGGSEKSEVADNIEEILTNEGVAVQMNGRIAEIKHALTKIEKDEREGTKTFGICETSGEPIPTERLEANPAARTLVGLGD